ncbi:Alpha/Beta hydrolase protein [Stachybotrys elegans]|uniref:Alpha/Beta hydrolase protein n=1 Tax=Stachybotrys elegans TaxID=80388 RepID=A0A8K0SGT6_9HYPO|nr:Alpha/Beta hydrolase protein [Stachybotrys elegans]
MSRFSSWSGRSLDEPTGVETTLFNVPTYVAKPEPRVKPRGIIVFITDIFGWQSNDNRRLCDAYAKKGQYLVYCPDFLNGAISTRAVAGSWVDNIMTKPSAVIQLLPLAVSTQLNTRISETHPRVIAFFQALRKNPPPFNTDSLKIGVAGFGWGAKHAVMLAQAHSSTCVRRHQSQRGFKGPQPLVDCAFIAYPAMLKVPEDPQLVTMPLSVAVGDCDNVLRKSEAERVKIILERRQGLHEIHIWPGARHGFAVKNETTDEEDIWCADLTERQALAWFAKWLV